jgi:hypothetical protein
MEVLERSNDKRLDHGQWPMKTTAVRQHLLKGHTLKLLLLACFWFSAHALAIGGRGGGGEGGGRGGGRGSEGAHFGDEGSIRFGGHSGGGGSNDARPSVTRDGFGNRLPGVVTADEEGGKIQGHNYDPDDVDLTERALHGNEFAVLSDGHLVNWQSSSDASASEAKAYRAKGIRTFSVLFALTILALALCMFVYR